MKPLRFLWALAFVAAAIGLSMVGPSKALVLHPPHKLTLDASTHVASAWSPTLRQRVLVPQANADKAFVRVPVAYALTGVKHNGFYPVGSKLAITFNGRVSEVAIKCAGKPFVAEGSIQVQLRGTDDDVISSTPAFHPTRWTRMHITMMLAVLDDPTFVIVLKRTHTATCANAPELIAAGEVAEKRIKVFSYTPRIRGVPIK